MTLKELIHDHTEKWAQRIAPQMNDPRAGWVEVKALYDEHNKEIEILTREYLLKHPEASKEDR